MRRRSDCAAAIAALALPAMLMLTAATAGPKPEKKNNPAIWIALFAVFIGAGTSIFAAMTASRSKTAKQRSDSGDAVMADGGSGFGNHHSHDSGHSGGSDGGGGDGGGGDGGGGGD